SVARAPRLLYSFPTRRSSDLPSVRALPQARCAQSGRGHRARPSEPVRQRPVKHGVGETRVGEAGAAESVNQTELSFGRDRLRKIDRKSTRLNSSHVSISYAVF